MKQWMMLENDLVICLKDYMIKVTKLQDVKDLKKLKIIAKELEELLKIYTLSLQVFGHYKKYLPCQETIKVLQSNKMLLEIHLNKIKKNIEKLND